MECPLSHHSPSSSFNVQLSLRVTTNLQCSNMSGPATSFDRSAQVEHDVVFDYMQEICDKYQGECVHLQQVSTCMCHSTSNRARVANKEHLQRCLEQIRALERENVSLQNVITKL